MYAVLQLVSQHTVHSQNFLSLLQELWLCTDGTATVELQNNQTESISSVETTLFVLKHAFKEHEY